MKKKMIVSAGMVIVAAVVKVVQEVADSICFCL